MLFGLPIYIFSVFFWRHELYVDSQTGSNDVSCWTSGNKTPCATLNFALKGIQNFTDSSVIYLYPGNYTLEHGQETQLTGKSQVAIIGTQVVRSGEKSAVIKCSPLTGLAFFWCDNILLQSLILQDCGGVQISTSRNLSSRSFELLMFQVAVYMLYCQNVHVVDVIIESSNGSGLTMYNTVGNVSISGCIFRKNGLTGGDGGGGLQIEWSYCNPVNALVCPEEGPSPVDTKYVSHSVYKITNCNFISNIARGGPYKLSNEGRESYTFGRGGGISVIFKGLATGNQVTIESSVILQNNQANYGGGFYIAYHDSAKNNNVEMIEMTVTNNSNTNIEDVWDKRSGGGGNIIHTAESNGEYNSLHLTACYFTNNIGPYTGGGLSVEVDSIVTLLLDRLVFIDNHAYLGSAIYLHTRKLLYHIQPVRFNSSHFFNNRPIRNHYQAFTTLPYSGAVYSHSLPLSFAGHNIFYENQASTIELHDSRIEITSAAVMNFTGNSGLYGGAIALYDCSFIVLHNATRLWFANNKASSLGGAIYSGYCSHFSSQPSRCFMRYYKPTLHPDEWDTEMIFSNNELSQKVTSNAVYIESLSSCWWSLVDSSTVTLLSIQNTLYWNNWQYEPDDRATSIQSGVAYINSSERFSVQPGGRLRLGMYDGTAHLVSNDLEARICISELFQDILRFGSNVYDNCTTESEPIVYQCCSQEACEVSDQTFSVDISFSESNTFEGSLNISLTRCHFPFKFKSKSKDTFFNLLTQNSSDSICTPHACVIPQSGFCCTGDCMKYYFYENIDLCSVGSYFVGTDIGYCLSLYDSQPIIGRCPASRYYDYHANMTFEELLERVMSNSDSPFIGRLNGQCNGTSYDPHNVGKQYGLSINSPDFECIECTNPWLHLLVFFTAEIIPITLLVLLIGVLHINLTSGLLNGYIFYSQVLSILITVFDYRSSFLYTLFPNRFFINIGILPYNIWNLNFVPYIYPLCISPNIDALGVISIWYIIAAYPLVLLFFLYCWIRMYDKGFIFVFQLSRPVHRCLARFWHRTNIEPSMTHFISSIYVLCYSQIAITSIRLLSFSNWYSLTEESKWGRAFYYDGTLEYFGFPHVFLGLLAMTVLSVVVVIPTLYLSLYPFKWFQKILTCCKLRRQFLITLVDDYTGAFKNGCDNTRDYRFFAGLYLLGKLGFIFLSQMPYQLHVVVTNSVILLTSLAGGTVMIFRPYRKNIHNFADFVLFLCLRQISGIGTSAIMSRFYTRQYLVTIGCIVFMYVPAFIVTLYCLFWMSKTIFRGCCNRCIGIHCNGNIFKAEGSDLNEVNTNNANISFPDRVNNPDEYDEYHVGIMPRDCPVTIVSLGKSNDQYTNSTEESKPSELSAHSNVTQDCTSCSEGSNHSRYTELSILSDLSEH